MATAYFKGDLAYYTGKTAQLHGGLFYEVIMAEGHMKGQVKHIVTPPATHVKPQQLAENMLIAQKYEDKMQCNCDLDNWEPTKLTGHSSVCRIHKATMREVDETGA